jgi:cytochrome c553
MNRLERIGRTWPLAAAALLSTAPALAQDARALHLKALAATCANCHGTGGRAIDNSEIPGLAGMPASYLVAQMQAFKKGERPATVMHQLAKGYSDEQIQQLAAWFAAQKK